MVEVKVVVLLLLTLEPTLCTGAVIGDTRLAVQKELRRKRGASLVGASTTVSTKTGVKTVNLQQQPQNPLDLEGAPGETMFPHGCESFYVKGCDLVVDATEETDTLPKRAKAWNFANGQDYVPMGSGTYDLMPPATPRALVGVGSLAAKDYFHCTYKYYIGYANAEHLQDPVTTPELASGTVQHWLNTSTSSSSTNYYLYGSQRSHTRALEMCKVLCGEWIECRSFAYIPGNAPFDQCVLTNDASLSDVVDKSNNALFTTTAPATVTDVRADGYAACYPLQLQERPSKICTGTALEFLNRVPAQRVTRRPDDNIWGLAYVDVPEFVPGGNCKIRYYDHIGAGYSDTLDGCRQACSKLPDLSMPVFKFSTRELNERRKSHTIPKAPHNCFGIYYTGPGSDLKSTIKHNQSFCGFITNPACKVASMAMNPSNNVGIDFADSETLNNSTQLRTAGPEAVLELRSCSVMYKYTTKETDHTKKMNCLWYSESQRGAYVLDAANHTAGGGVDALLPSRPVPDITDFYFETTSAPARKFWQGSYSDAVYYCNSLKACTHIVSSYTQDPAQPSETMHTFAAAQAAALSTGVAGGGNHARMWHVCETTTTGATIDSILGLSTASPNVDWAAYTRQEARWQCPARVDQQSTLAVRILPHDSGNYPLNIDYPYDRDELPGQSPPAIGTDCPDKAEYPACFMQNEQPGVPMRTSGPHYKIMREEFLTASPGGLLFQLGDTGANRSVECGAGSILSVSTEPATRTVCTGLGVDYTYSGCESCPTGKASLPGQSGCSMCPAGTVSVSHKGICEPTWAGDDIWFQFAIYYFIVHMLPEIIYVWGHYLLVLINFAIGRAKTTGDDGVMQFHGATSVTILLKSLFKFVLWVVALILLHACYGSGFGLMEGDVEAYRVGMPSETCPDLWEYWLADAPTRNPVPRMILFLWISVVVFGLLYIVCVRYITTPVFQISEKGLAWEAIHYPEKGQSPRKEAKVREYESLPEVKEIVMKRAIQDGKNERKARDQARAAGGVDDDEVKGPRVPLHKLISRYFYPEDDASQTAAAAAG